MADDQSDAQGAEQAGGGAPSAQQSYAYASTNQSQVTAYTQQPKRGGIVNRLKFPKVGIEDVAGNSQILKWILGEFIGTFLLCFFGIGSIITVHGTEFAFVMDKDKKILDKSPIPTAGFRPSRKYEEKELGGVKLEDYTIYLKLASAGGPGGGANPRIDGLSNLHISFAFGIAVASVAQAIGHVSGCHLNPAVSWGLVAAGECSIIKAAIYTVAQIFGAVFGCGLLKLMTWRIVVGLPETDPKTGKYLVDEIHGWHLGVSGLGAADLPTGIAMECWLTFILIFVVCGATDSGRKDVTGSVPLAIGLTVFLCHVVGIGYTGSSVNPARSIGPLFFVSSKVVPYRFDDIAVYIVGPLLGGVLAGFLYNLFFRAPDPSPQVAPGDYSRA